MDAKQVVEIFVEQGLITEDDGANLLLQASNSESPIEQILVDNGIVSERGFEKTIADSIGAEPFDLSEFEKLVCIEIRNIALKSNLTLISTK